MLQIFAMGQSPLKTLVCSIFISVLLVGCAESDVEEATVVNDSTGSSTVAFTDVAPIQDTTTPAPEARILPQEGECGFIGSWSPVEVSGQKLTKAQQQMVLTFRPDGTCTTERPNNSIHGTWTAEACLKVTLTPQEGSKLEMQILEITDSTMTFSSHADLKTVCKRVL